MLRTSQWGNLDIWHGIISALMVGEALGSEIEEKGKRGGNSRLIHKVSNGQSSERQKCKEAGEGLTSR